MNNQEMNNQEIKEYLLRILLKLDISKSLLVDGKIIPADKKLQGVRDNLVKLINLISESELNDESNSNK
jgi:hypothetical protein